MDTIQSYVYRGQRPKPMATAPPKRVTTAAGNRLTTVLENDTALPGGPQSPQAQSGWPLTNQPSHRSSHHGIPPHHSEEKRPPSYATQDGSGGPGHWNSRPDDEKPPGLLRRIADRRGGWKRLALIILVVLIVLIIALGVGLGVGLSKKNSSSNGSSDSSPASPSTPTGPFPIGAYANTAFLTNVETDCTTNAAAWTCYPYKTYSSDASGSEDSFPWIITKSSNSKSTQYVISSTNNSLSDIVFDSSPLTLEDEGTPNERYTFSIPNVIKNVIPSVSITNDQYLSTCFYNSTTLNGSLYTTKQATLVDSDGNQPDAVSMQMKASSNGIVFDKTWPGAISVNQVISPGANVPNCYRLENGRSSGIRVPAPASGTGQCSCLYMNYGDGGGGP